MATFQLRAIYKTNIMNSMEKYSVFYKSYRNTFSFLKDTIFHPLLFFIVVTNKNYSLVEKWNLYWKF